MLPGGNQVLFTDIVVGVGQILAFYSRNHMIAELIAKVPCVQACQIVEVGFSNDFTRSCNLFVGRFHTFHIRIESGGDNNQGVAQAVLNHVIQNPAGGLSVGAVAEIGEPVVLIISAAMHQIQDIIRPLRVIVGGKIDIDRFGDGIVGAHNGIDGVGGGFVGQGFHGPLLAGSFAFQFADALGGPDEIKIIFPVVGIFGSLSHAGDSDAGEHQHQSDNQCSGSFHYDFLLN